MKGYVLAFLFFAVIFHTITFADAPPHLFILSGQSNMDALDPQEIFIPVLAKRFGRDRLLVIKESESGQPLRRWYKGWQSAEGTKNARQGDIYDRLMQKVYAALQGKRPESVTLIWMHGEKDAQERHGQVYLEGLEGLIQQFAEDLEQTDIHAVIGRLSDFDMDNDTFLHWTLVRQAQMEAARRNSNIVWVNTDDLNDGISQDGKMLRNDLHYSAEGYRVLARRFAEAAVKLIDADNS